MAAPEHVPSKVAEKVRVYSSPPRRPESWTTDRPADFAGETRQPAGERLGSQGPDQGYAIKLGRLLEGELQLSEGEHARDALAGIVAVALKRASIIGRAPVVHDLRLAATLFGFLDTAAPADLVELRRELFEEVSHFHHYAELRSIVDMVPGDVLVQTPHQVAQRYSADWRDQIILDRVP